MQQRFKWSAGKTIEIGLIVAGLVAIAAFAILSQIDRQPGVQRITNEEIAFHALGVVVEPSDGWSHLATAGPRRALRPVFVNESAALICRLQTFPLQSWPPDPNDLGLVGSDSPAPQLSDDKDLLAQDGNQQEDRDPSEPLPSLTVRNTVYENCSVEWLEIDGSAPELLLIGRLRAGRSADLLINVMLHSDAGSIDSQLHALCDSIRSIR